MANLKTHLQYTAVGSGLVASAFYSAEVLSPSQALICWALGVFGGVLPDIDSDDDKAAGIIFGLFSVLACAFTLTLTIEQYPLFWAWAACAIVFVIVQFGLRTLFVRFTSHRGVFHSVLGCTMFVLLTACLSNLSGIKAIESWFFAMFIGLGYAFHLLLDEVFKVNLMGNEYKKPFGGAIKLIDIKNVKSTAFMAGLTGVLIYFMPDASEFVHVAFNAQTYSEVVGVMF